MHFAPPVIKATVNTGSDAALNLRESASSDSAILCELANGTVVEIISEDGEWANVRFESYTGYVMCRYIFTDTEE